MDKYEARRDKYERFLRYCMESAEPDIIIWGPGPNNEQGYHKRECVRDAIQDVVPKGDVVFPEDRDMKKISSELLDSEDVDNQGLLQALNADIIIALDISPAVGEEIARYSAKPRVASKLFVVTTDGDKSGYQKALRDKGFVHVLKADEMKTCAEPKKLCISHVRSWCMQNLRE